MLVQTGSSCESSWTMTDPSLDLAASGRPWWRKDERIAIVAAVLTATLFFIAGRWGDSVNPDTEAVAIPAWHLVHEGSLDLSTIDEIRENLEDLGIWFVARDDGAIFSNRAPGLIFLAAPFYWASPDTSFSYVPTTAAAQISTFAAVIISWFVFRRLVGIPFATAAAGVLALGTTTWSISATELWPHGPGQLAAALSLFTLSNTAWVGTGLALAAGILIRPITAVHAAVLGALESVRKRAWRPALQIGVTSAIGITLLVLYNRTVFGEWSVRGGYSSDFTSGAIEDFSFSDYIQNVGVMFLSPVHGLFICSPAVAVAAIAAYRFRVAVPGWAKSALMAGFVYLMVHAGLNRASGGLAFLYRYPLEPLIFAAPALAVGAHLAWRASYRWRLYLTCSSLYSVAVQIVAVFLLKCVPVSEDWCSVRFVWG